MLLATIRIATPFRRDLVIASNGEKIEASDFVAPKAGARKAPAPNALLAEARSQVLAYFARRLRRFDLPLLLEGTPFCEAVWGAVAALSYGEFVSYADVARAVGRPLAHRGVAMAMGRAPLDLFVPAHRVVGSDGRVRGSTPGSLRLQLVAFERQEEQAKARRNNGAV
jgi:methylated-DNA-[protein]-cysteine S-methyltransferase